MDVKTFKLLCLDGYSKQFSDECCLAWRLSFLHPSHLSFPDHVHDLISLEGSPCRFKRKEAQSRFDQPFDEAVVLFNEGVHVFDLRFRLWESQGVFERLWQAGLQEYDELAGIGWDWQSADSSTLKALEPLPPSAPLPPTAASRDPNGASSVIAEGSRWLWS